MPARISFIVPTFNRAAYIGEALDAILSQADDADEILVVDDGSTDDTAAVVAGYSPAVRYVRQDNQGKSVALNRGLGLTDGDLVWICDDDDVLLPGAVAALLAPLADPRIDFAFGRYYPFRTAADGSRERLPFHWPDLGQGSIARHVLEDAFIMQNAALVRRRCYDSAGPFDTAMLRSLDYEMFVRLALGFDCAFVDREIFAQRKHDGARGPAIALHAASAANDTWREYDRRIFTRLNHGKSLAPYRAMFDAPSAHLQERAALLQRACVSARHDLWETMAIDLRAAAAVAPDVALDDGEVAICRRMLCGKCDLAGALAPEHLVDIDALYQSGGNSRRIVSEILRGALWRLRRREGADVAHLAGLLRGGVGIWGSVGLVLGHLFRSRRHRAAAVVERRALRRRFLIPLASPIAAGDAPHDSRQLIGS